MSIISPNISKLEEMLRMNQYGELLEYLRKCQLEAFNHMMIIQKTIDQLDMERNYSILIELLELLGEDPNDVFQLEIKEGMRCLIKHCNDDNSNRIFKLVCLFIKKRKTIDPDIIRDVLGCLLRKPKENIKQEEYQDYYTMIKEYIQYEGDLSHSFWEKIITNFQGHLQDEIVSKLLHDYPLIYSSSESYWKKLINAANITILTSLFQVFYSKYLVRKANENLQSYSLIFNHFLKTSTDSPNNNDNLSIQLFNTMLAQNIQIEPETLNQFLINHIKHNPNNDPSIQDLIVKSSTNITSDIISNIITLLFQERNISSILDILKLVKRKSIKAEYSSLHLSSDILKEVIFYMLNHSNKNSLSSDLRSHISDFNWEYLSKLDSVESFELIN